ncbi:MAG: methyltransferase domain-containing protein [Chitinivibrionales bacterium]|nr:methyltransferase domain-containing protein [Chitinivibrionales bacterium]
MSKSLPGNYAGYYDKAGFIPQQTDRHELAFFASLAPAGRPLDVLDLGCAEGALSVLLAQKGHEVTAADISPSQLQMVSENAETTGVKISTALCNIENDLSSLKGRQFDLIFCMDVLEHLKSPVAGLENIRSLLSEKGTAIIHTPNSCAFWQVVRYAMFRKKRKNYFDPRNVLDLHFQLYDAATLEKALNFVGLKVERFVSTRLSLPFIHRYKIFAPVFRVLSTIFPFLSDTLLVVCSKTEPIDMERQIEYWERKYH